MNYDNLLAFTSFVLLGTISPGPSMLLALRYGIAYGTKQSIISGLGNTIANLLLITISIFGLGALIVTSDIAFNLIKYTGAAYLIYLGIKASTSSHIQLDANNKPLPNNKLNLKKNNKLFLDGFLVAILNPKGLICITAILPQFIDSKTISLPYFSLIISIAGFIAFSCFMLYALFGKKVRFVLKSPKYSSLFNILVGIIFICFGLTILFNALFLKIL